MRDALDKNTYQFDYFSESYEKFENTFYKYADFDIPLTFISDDILKSMLASGNNYFKLNAANTKDNQDHYFIFKQVECPDNTKIKRFVYIGCK